MSKGSRSRITNLKKYGENHDKINWTDSKDSEEKKPSSRPVSPK